MYFWSNTLNCIYSGDLQPGDREATQAEIDAHLNPPPTVEDYDAAMEAHLLAERTARGYTLREPSDYAGSAVPRFAQDAQDWIAHRDQVMLYALDVQNTVAAGSAAPTLADFKAALPVIVWTAQEDESTN